MEELLRDNQIVDIGVKDVSSKRMANACGAVDRRNVRHGCWVI